MDERQAKRVASVQQIKQKPYYRPGVVDEEPDPLDETCPTRKWRYKLRVWVVALKRMQEQERGNAAAHDLMAGPH